MAGCGDDDSDSPFDCSPSSPASATLREAADDGPHPHRSPVHRTAGNRPSGDHHVRIAQAVRAEERLYRYHQQPPRSSQSGEERAQGSVGSQSPLWTRRQQQRTQTQTQAQAQAQADSPTAEALSSEARTVEDARQASHQ